jgi:putative acetyltransferase
VNLRRAMNTDTQKICQMHKASIISLCRSHYTPEQVEAWAGPKRPEHYERLIRVLNVFVMEEADGIMGFGALDASAADIQALYLAPEPSS